MSTTGSMPGWPYTDFATGWYQIGYSAEIRPGDLQPAKWLNQDLVMYRTETGRLVVLDAYCPHMGAHLGHRGEFGGRVCGENIECPWHGWQWSPDGRNVRIPYAEDKLVRATIRTHAVREIDGVIVLWYDHQGREPHYEWPGLPFATTREDYYAIDWTVDGPHRVKPQFPMENAADPHHFPYVHGSGVDAEFTEFSVDGAYCTNTMLMKFGAGKPSTWLTPEGPVDGSIDNFFWGASLGIARFNIAERVCIHLVALCPIDHDSTMFFSTVTHTREPGDTGNQPTGLAKKMMDAQHVQIRNDFHIWQHMKYKVSPMFMGEAEQSRYAFIRKHFDQFYPNPVYGGEVIASDSR
jgi:3-ketosteroid 9alpha-monooxygenase subunit A